MKENPTSEEIRLMAIWKKQAQGIWKDELSCRQKNQLKKMSPEHIFILGFMNGKSYTNPVENN